MKVSLNTVRQYTDVDVSVDELVSKINQQLGGVEEVINLGERYEKATIVKIVSAEQHPNADRLRVCKVDDGGVIQDVPRDDNGYVQVVCGAPNAHAGIFAVWLPPKSTVPASYDEKELFVLDARELRGILSQGMLAAADELAIGSDHEGIIEINPDEWKPSSEEIKPGANFAKTYGFDDTIIDIENKMFTHRPDLFGQLGVAREIAGIQHKQFISPDWYKNVPEFNDASGLELDVFNDALEKVPRFMAVAIKNIDVKPSPLWLQCALVAMGSKPINNIVDVTNYVMLLTAQPTHAYDYDKLRGHKLGARMAHEGEKVTLLNHKEYELDENDIVIADADGPVGLAGIMGGGESEVDENTKNIVLEVATFDMYTVRKSSMRHGVFTDALTRFNKGQSPLQNDHILNLLMMSIFDVSSGEQGSRVFDEKVLLNYRREIITDTRFIGERLGLVFEFKEIQSILNNVEMEVKFRGEQKREIKDSLDDIVFGEKAELVAEGFEVQVPFWRTDIELPEDVVEEVGRLYGFDKLPRELPRRSIKPVAKNASRELAQTVRERLARAGANEVLTYSFVHENVLMYAGQEKSQAYQLSNALSPDLQYYRLSLTPSLLDKVHSNVRGGYDEFALFEIGKAHSKLANPQEDGLPAERQLIALTFASTKSLVNSPYYEVKAFIDYILTALALEVRYEPLAESLDAVDAPFEPKRSAHIYDQKSGKLVGVVGEYRASVIKAFKLPVAAAGFELDLQVLSELASQANAKYTPLSRYPSSERDICFQVNTDVSYQHIIDAAKKGLDETGLETTITPIDMYSAPSAQTKNITIRLKLTSHEKTLTGEEVNNAAEAVATAVIDATRATVI